ncbi:hypothetical protein A2U01_0035522, partial [Trifolium medium]|nr:hypothetical protein [Trifolium medium]
LENETVEEMYLLEKLSIEPWSAHSEAYVPEALLQNLDLRVCLLLPESVLQTCRKDSSEAFQHICFSWILLCL